MSDDRLLALDDLIVRIQRLPERAMRRAELSRWMRYGPASKIAQDLEQLLRLAMKRHDAALETQLAVADLLLNANETDLLVFEALDLAAGHESLEGVKQLLSDFRPLLAVEDDGRRNTRLAEHVPLGMRRWQARGGESEQLEALMADPDPLVIGNICTNPRIREQDVVAMVARRPNWSEVLDAIARSRWLASQTVREALVLNPYARPSLVISLLPMLKVPVLAGLRHCGQVHEAVVAMTRYLLTLVPGFED